MKNKKIYLLFHGRFPSEKAASLFAAKSCESFADLGAEVTLIVPKRTKTPTEGFGEYYNIKENFTVKYVPTLDAFSFLGGAAFYVSLFVYSVTSFLFLLFNAEKDSVVYTNETLPLLFASARFKNTLFEVHDYPENKKSFYRLLFSSIQWILVTNKWKLQRIEKDFPQTKGKIFLERNAVEISEFAIPESKEEAQEKLDYSFPQNKKIILYTGHLYDWKGVDVLASAASLLPEEFQVIFVGGTKNDVKAFSKKYGHIKNLSVLGFRPHAEIPLWQRASDLLVLPNTGKQDISKFYTSPMKLFEYMASGTPILASDIPSIAEILNKTNAFLVESDNPEKLAGEVQKIFESEERVAKAKQSQIDVVKYSWEKRAERISQHLFAN